MFKDKSKGLLIGLVVIVQVGLAGYVTWCAMRPSAQGVKEVPLTRTVVGDPKNSAIREIYKQMLLTADAIDASTWQVEPEFFGYLSQRRSKAIKFFRASSTVDDNVVRYFLKDLDVLHLALTDCHVTARCLKDVACIKTLERLEVNDLQSHPDDWQDIVSLSQLHALRAKHCCLNDRTLQILGSHPFQYLDLRGNELITDGGVAHLNREKLDTLSVALSHSITDLSAEMLSHISTLERVDLAQTSVGDVGLLALANLKSLRALNLKESSVTNSGLNKFKPPANLEKLMLNGCKNVTSSCVGEFQLKHPTCFVEY